MKLNATRTTRLAHEVKMFQEQSPWGVKCVPETYDNFDKFVADVCGPGGSPYEGGTFKLIITIPQRYPYVPPKLKFVTPIYHPNIDKGGRICMGILKMPPNGGWLPTITLESVLVCIQNLMAYPNPVDPLMIDIAHQYNYEHNDFIDDAKKYTAKYAIMQ